MKSKKNPQCTEYLEPIHKLNEVGPGLFSVSHNLIKIKVSNPGLPIALNEYPYYSTFWMIVIRITLSWTKTIHS